MTTEPILKMFGEKLLYLKQLETNSLVRSGMKVAGSAVWCPSTSAVAFQVCLWRLGV